MHFDEGMLQTYLDNQLSYEEKVRIEAHLKECELCREKLECLAGQEQIIAQQLGGYIRAAKSYEVDVVGKWEQFQSLVQFQSLGQQGCENHRDCQEICPMDVDSQNSSKRRWKLMSKSWQRWIAGVAAVAVVCGVFALPTVQSAAAQLLKVFRVESIETVKLTPDDLTRIMNQIENEVGTIEMKSFGKVEVLKTSQYDRISIDEAREKGFSDPEYLPEGVQKEDVELATGEKLKFSLNVDKVNDLLRQLGGKTPLPEAIRGKAFTLETFDALSRTYKMEGGKSIRVSKTQSPRLEVAADIDAHEVMASLSDLPFLPKDLQDQLKQISSLDSTLIVPELKGQTERLTINGTTVIHSLSESDSSVTLRVEEGGEDELTVDGQQVQVTKDPDSGYSSHDSYLWIKDGNLFLVECFGLDRSEAEKIVKSLR